MLLAPNFLGERPPPEFLEWDYKVQLDSDHVAKFQDDRSMDLGERVAKKRKKITGKTSPSGTVVPGGLIRNLSMPYFIRIIPYFDERFTYEVKKSYNLDLSVEWFPLLFRTRGVQ